MNEMSEADFKALAPGVSWYYNWDCRPHHNGESAGPQFIPMVWGSHPNALRGLDQYLASAAPKPPVVFAINEPNMRGQAFLTPLETADLYRRVKSVTDQYQIPLVGPHMALGSAPGDSITALDPLENKTTTYAFMVPFLHAVLFYLERWGITPPALGIHSYGGLGELKWAVELVHSTFGCPVWVTEFGFWNSPNSEDARKYMIEATEFLERTPYVAGYAWFKDRVQDNPNISLLEPESGKLSRLGETYVSLCVGGNTHSDPAPPASA